VNYLASLRPLSLLLPDYSLDDVQACAKLDFQIGGAIKGVYVKLGVSEKKCKEILNEIKGESKRHVTSALTTFTFLALLVPVFLLTEHWIFQGMQLK
jgi:hypothetical protein